jgi:DNA repair exonuclease SbcCD ATPase subunit
LETTTSDEPSVSAEKVLKRQKKQARREAKLMLAIKAANKDLKKAQKKQSKAQARLEKRNASLQTLEARLEELRAQSPQAATGAESTSLLNEETRLPEGTVVMIDAAKMDALP